MGTKARATVASQVPQQECPHGQPLLLLPYRRMVIGALPLLLDLDRQPILERWISDEDAKSSDEEEFPELSGPFCAERGDYFPKFAASPGSHCPRGLRE